MQPIKENWNSNGLTVTSTWIADTAFEKYKPITQAYGVCFTKEGKVVIVKDLKDWIIPGGTPEHGETPEKTLRREVNEEASVEIDVCKMIGCFKQELLNNPNKKEGDVFYQLRFVAIIKEVKEMMPDPCTGRTFQRLLIEPAEFNNYVKWGNRGKEMFRIAYTCFKHWEKTGKV